MTGFDNECVPRIIVDAMMMLAAIKLKLVAGDFVRPVGVNSESISIDGGSQSRSYASTAFAGIIEQYRKTLFGDPSVKNDDGLLQLIRNNYRGIPMVSC